MWDVRIGVIFCLAFYRENQIEESYQQESYELGIISLKFPQLNCFAGLKVLSNAIDYSVLPE